MELSLLQHNSDNHTQVPEQLQRFNAVVCTIRFSSCLGQWSQDGK